MIKASAYLLLVLSFASPVAAQRAYELQAIIHTPLSLTARQQCRSIGGNLLLTVQFSFHHCYFTNKIHHRK